MSEDLNYEQFEKQFLESFVEKVKEYRMVEKIDLKRDSESIFEAIDKQNSQPIIQINLLAAFENALDPKTVATDFVKAIKTQI